MSRKVTRIVILGTATALAFGITTPALAHQNEPDTSPMGVINQISPDTLTALTAQTGSDPDSVAIGQNDGITVDLPSDPEAGITLTGGASETPMTVSLPEADNSESPASLTAGVVSYPNNDFTTVPVIHNDGSLQITTVIANSDAPSTYAYEFGIPDGSSMSMDENGAVAIVNDSGDWVAGVMPAWATDAAGVAVSTHFEIAGTTLTQVIDLSDPSIAYPVVADPWLWRALVDHTTWDAPANRRNKRLLVYPTKWGRAWTGVATWNSHWKEVLAKRLFVVRGDGAGSRR